MVTQKIDDHNSKIQTQRLKMGGINAAHEADRSLQKQIKIYENRLDKAYIKYNEVCNPFPMIDLGLVMTLHILGSGHDHV